MADTFETVFDYNRTESIVNENGVMTTRFAQLITYLVDNSNSTGEIIDDETLSISSFEGNQTDAKVSELSKAVNDIRQSQLSSNELLYAISEQSKIIESLKNELAQKTNESARITELSKKVADLQELIHVS